MSGVRTVIFWNDRSIELRNGASVELLAENQIEKIRPSHGIHVAVHFADEATARPSISGRRHQIAVSAQPPQNADVHFLLSCGGSNEYVADNRAKGTKIAVEAAMDSLAVIPSKIVDITRDHRSTINLHPDYFCPFACSSPALYSSYCPS